jgi:hypothetical protein
MKCQKEVILPSQIVIDQFGAVSTGPFFAGARSSQFADKCIIATQNCTTRSMWRNYAHPHLRKNEDGDETLKEVKYLGKKLWIVND